VGADQTLRVWDGTPLAADSGPALRTFAGHTGRVSSVAFDHDGHRLVSGSFDRTVKVWDVATGKELRTLGEHPGAVQGVAFSPQGYLLVSASWARPEDGPASGRLKVWDSRTWQALRNLDLPDSSGFVAVAVTPDGRRLLAADANSVVVWETTTFHPVLVQYDHDARVISVAVSPDGRRAASADLVGEVRIWDLDDARPVFAVLALPPLPNALVNLHAALMALPLRTFRAHTTRATGVAFSKDLLATCGMDGATRLWDARTFKKVAELRGHSSGVRCLAFSPDGRRLATGGNDATIRIWDMATRRELLVLRGHTDAVCSVTFSRDGRYVASGSLDRTVKIWDAQTPRKTRGGP
jgi:WD40 repeat protein